MAHGPEMPTIPGYQSEKKRPWWAAAFIGGVGLAVGLLMALGMIGPAARAESPQQAVAGFVRADEQRLERIEARINEMAERLARMEGRLDRK